MKLRYDDEIHEQHVEHGRGVGRRFQSFELNLDDCQTLYFLTPEQLREWLGDTMCGLVP